MNLENNSIENEFKNNKNNSTTSPSQTLKTDTKTYIIVIIAFVILSFLILTVILLILKTKTKGIDLSIENAKIEKISENLFKFTFKIKNKGSEQINSSFYISAYSGHNLIEWQETSVLNSGETLNLAKTGGMSLTNNTITIIIDSKNQTNDINRDNNVYFLETNAI